MNRPISERDELLLNRLLDDELPAGEAAALRARLEREPDLRAAFDKLTRIDTMLAARRSDQPAINWSSFHRAVMQQVAAEAGSAAAPRVIRLGNWLRVAVPLAAAAAIALIVWLGPFGRQGHDLTRPDGRTADNNVSPANVTPNTPDPAPTGSTGTLLVQFHRPESETPADSGIQVRYARSDALLDEYRAMDTRNRSRPPWQLFLAGNTRRGQPMPDGSPVETPPL